MSMIERHPVIGAVLSAAIWLLRSACPARAAEDQFFDSAGVKLRYIVEGQGEPVVLIHGFGASLHLQWGAPGVLTSLAKDHRVIAYDNRGNGRSGKPHGPAQYGDEMVRDALRLLDHLDVPKAHIVGYSMGALITAKLLAEHPERFLTATLAGGGWAKANDQRGEFLSELAESLDAGQGIGPLLIKLTPAGRAPPTARQLRLASRLFTLFNDQRALAGVARGMREFTVTEEQLRANRVPTLALIGETDPLKVTVDELAEVMPNLTVKVIDGSGHIQTFFRPEFLRELKVFLSAHSAEALPAAR